MLSSRTLGQESRKEVRKGTSRKPVFSAVEWYSRKSEGARHNILFLEDLPRKTARYTEYDLGVAG
jgi:hypothetical protein